MEVLILGGNILEGMVVERENQRQECLIIYKEQSSPDRPSHDVIEMKDWVRFDAILCDQWDSFNGDREA